MEIDGTSSATVQAPSKAEQRHHYHSCLGIMQTTSEKYCLQGQNQRTKTSNWQSLQSHTSMRLEGDRRVVNGKQGTIQEVDVPSRGRKADRPIPAHEEERRAQVFRPRSVLSQARTNGTCG